MLRDSILIEANMTAADLSGAVLTDALVSGETLDAAESLKGAYMPDGTIHE